MQNLLLLLLVSICVSCTAQKKVALEQEDVKSNSGVKMGSKSIAVWSFAKKATANPKEYLIIAKLKLAKDWHVFDFDPGGDGFLIAPDFTFDNKDIKILKKQAKGELILNTFAGVDGDVRYYENEVSFEVLVRSNNQGIKGSVYYQLCDHEKCLAPTEESFTLK